MTTSDNGISFITRWEGSRNEVYLDPSKLPTLGVGHLLTPEELVRLPVGTKISDEQIKDYLRKDLSTAEKGVESNVVTELSQSEFDSLVSFTFNVGVHNFKKSTLLRLLNSGLSDDAGNEFLRWTFSQGRTLPGLVKRREAERLLFLKGQYNESPGQGSQDHSE